MNNSYFEFLRLHLRIFSRPSMVTYCQFNSVQSLNRVQLFATPWTAACQASLSITNSQSLLKLMSIIKDGRVIYLEDVFRIEYKDNFIFVQNKTYSKKEIAQIKIKF